ncbi:hypothetical protein BW686_09610 [Pseudomonas syringae]|uniref:Uncharacterized protein n=1 Tax=Pseudomonas syringae TaxID=317 RepID=A0A244ETF0_PSESX|nr:hypothetical protein BW686_09610 [Pseudomonas syringae]
MSHNSSYRRSAFYKGPDKPVDLASARRAWERTCPRKLYFGWYIFSGCSGPFANKFAPTAFGQNQKRTCVQRGALAR